MSDCERIVIDNQHCAGHSSLIVAMERDRALELDVLAGQKAVAEGEDANNAYLQVLSRGRFAGRAEAGLLACLTTIEAGECPQFRAPKA